MNSLLAAVLFSGVGFLAGALPFSVWLARLRGREVRAFGDGNPGAANAFRAGGAVIGITALLLDFLKAGLPVAAAWWWARLRGWPIVPVSLAPVLGHALSPFLRWRGGKAITATFGIWAGLTLWQGPSLLGAAFLVGKCLLRLADAVTVLLGMGVLLLGAMLWWRSPVLVFLALANALLLAWTHRRELRR